MVWVNDMNVPHFNPSQAGQYLTYLTHKMEGWFTWVSSVTYLNSFSVQRQSPLQVLTKPSLVQLWRSETKR